MPTSLVFLACVGACALLFAVRKTHWFFPLAAIILIACVVGIVVQL